MTVLELVHNLWTQLGESPALIHLFSFSSQLNSLNIFSLPDQFLHKPGTGTCNGMRKFKVRKK
jgi:hypothetical protein